MLFSPFTPTSLPGQPGTGALGDPGIFHREEMTVVADLLTELGSVTDTS